MPESDCLCVAIMPEIMDVSFVKITLLLYMWEQFGGRSVWIGGVRMARMHHAVVECC